ncbi:hypothetical protein CIB84_000696 [Bambusicola thoracicus]|uniref:Uncharacterized protein n=1 Tax=Bambusicola thoracicus TaxID=9083 RepID=A0A2P4TGR2_BAMTH|nr:hypothetical protein CIB84_000696 [Bambusicola thoracicus]
MLSLHLFHTSAPHPRGREHL